MRVTQSDTQALLAAIEQLNSDISAESLQQRTIAAVAALIPYEIAAFDGFNAEGAHTGESWTSSLLTGEQMEVFAAHIAEHPSFAATVIEKRIEALKITDFTSVEKFSKTALYNEFYRKVGVDRQLTIGLRAAPEHFYTCALSRRKKDFSERDRRLLNLFAPHLIQALRNASRLKKIELERDILLSAVGKITQGIIVIGEAGAIKFVSPAAENFLAKYFTADKCDAGKLPGELALRAEFYADNCQTVGFNPLPPLTVKILTGELHVNFLFNSNTRETFLLLEEREILSPAVSNNYGLTKREAEILLWIMQGKTNREIGILCNISWRTVQKHVEHIFKKLGVETRLAATISALGE